MSEKKRVQLNPKSFLTWVKDNPVTAIWLLLCASVLFNIGYFARLDVRYISFLNVGDYYAATIVSLLMMIFFSSGIWIFFCSKKENIISYTFKITGKYLSAKIKIVRLKHRLKRTGRDKLASDTSKPTNKLDKFIQKESKMLTIEMKAVDKQLKIIFRHIIEAFFGIGLFCIIYFIYLYDLFGIVGLIFLFSLFVATIYVDGNTKNKTVRMLLKLFMILFLVPTLGYLDLIYDMRNKDIKVCTPDQCFVVLRKIESGYFVLDKCDLLFLDNELNIQTRQKITKGHLPEVCNAMKSTV